MTNIDHETGAEMVGRLLYMTKFHNRALKLEPFQDFQIGNVWEISGPSNVGKTQTLLAACCNCIIPVKLGGLELSAVFIDAELKFSEYRMINMLESKLRAAVQSRSNDKQSDDDESDVESVVKESLKRFFLVKPEKHEDLVHVFDHLDMLILQKSESIFLVCLDSLTSFYWINRHHGEFDRETVDPGKTAQLQLSQRISRFLREHKLLFLASRLAVHFQKSTAEQPDKSTTEWRNLTDRTWRKLVTHTLTFSRLDEEQSTFSADFKEVFGAKESETVLFVVCDKGLCAA